MYFPSETVGKTFKTICQLLPFESCLNIIKAVLNENYNLVSTKDIIVYSIYTIVTLIITIIVFNKKMVSDNK